LSILYGTEVLEQFFQVMHCASLSIRVLTRALAKSHAHAHSETEKMEWTSKKLHHCTDSMDR
jgi:hypothetical protein